LSKHNGSNNACTSDENTNYYFEVGNLYLEQALDRFSQFFINPLFKSECVEKELNIIDSGIFCFIVDLSQLVFLF